MTERLTHTYKADHRPLYKKEPGWDYTHRRGKGNVKMEAEIRTMWPQAKGPWLPAEARNIKEEILPCSLQRKCGSANILISAQWHQSWTLASKLWGVDFCCLEPCICDVLGQLWETRTPLPKSIVNFPFLLPICSAKVVVSLGACSKAEKGICLLWSL